MNTSVAAGCILILLVLCLITALLDLPPAGRTAIELVLILLGALVGSRVKKQ